MQSGDIISYPEMCNREKASLQRGMNFRLPTGRTVLLMSTRRGAPYADEVQNEGRTLVYEGHDEPRRRDVGDPKTIDQPLHTPGGRLTQNGLFFQAAERARSGERPEKVYVYDKLRSGIWCFNGYFDLVDAWMDESTGRRVFKFKLVLRHAHEEQDSAPDADLGHTRVIPSHVKREVWKRDGGRCVICDKTDNLHFDHVIPFSRGGTSMRSENIQLLCARHNLEKRDRIE